MIGPEPHRQKHYQKVPEVTVKIRPLDWERTLGLRHSKSFQRCYNLKRFQQIIKLGINPVRIILADHCRLFGR